MKKDWTKDLKDRLAEHEMAAPEGLLDDVKAAMEARGMRNAESGTRNAEGGTRKAEGGTRKAEGGTRMARLVPLWSAVAVAAAVVAGVLLVGRYMPDEGSVTSGQATVMASAEMRNAEGGTRKAEGGTRNAEDGARNAEGEALLAVARTAGGEVLAVARTSEGAALAVARTFGGEVLAVARTSGGKALAVARTSGGEALAVAGVAGDSPLLGSASCSPAFTPVGIDVPAPVGGTQGTMEATMGTAAPSSRPAVTPRRSRFSFGPAAGAVGATNSSQGMALAMANPVSKDYPSGFDGKDVDATPIDATGERRTHYSRPVKVGVTVGYRLTDRWSLYSGVTYSYLKQKTTYDNMPWQTEKQRLHYVGIPLGVSYTIAQKGRFRAYASAGGEVQKLVKGRQTVSVKETGTTSTPATPMSATNGVIGLTAETTSSTTVTEHRPQFSVGAAVGAELRLVPHVNLYVEPSVTHYFDNGSAVDNTYKDKKTRAGVSMGLHLSF